MSAPDFYFAIHAMFRHIHDRYGMDVLVHYWRSMAREYYASRIHRWREGGPDAVAADWRTYFAHEPGAEVEITRNGPTVTLDIRTCPAIRHLRAHDRDIAPYFCEHCDHMCSEMAALSGFRFTRTGGMGSCQQTFTRITREGEAL